jgi:hypothetical protein
MRLAVAAVTYTNPELLSASHNNKPLAQLQLQPSFGGARFTALEKTYQAAYTGSIAGSLTRMGDIPLLANSCNLQADQWDGRPGLLGEVYEAWHRGIAGPPLSSLPRLQKIKSLQGDDGNLSLSKLTCAPKRLNARSHGLLLLRLSLPSPRTPLSIRSSASVLRSATRLGRPTGCGRCRVPTAQVFFWMPSTPSLLPSFLGSHARLSALPPSASPPTLGRAILGTLPARARLGVWPPLLSLWSWLASRGCHQPPRPA